MGMVRGCCWYLNVWGWVDSGGLCWSCVGEGERNIVDASGWASAGADPLLVNSCREGSSPRGLDVFLKCFFGLFYSEEIQFQVNMFLPSPAERRVLPDIVNHELWGRWDTSVVIVVLMIVVTDHGGLSGLCIRVDFGGWPRLWGSSEVLLVTLSYYGVDLAPADILSAPVAAWWRLYVGHVGFEVQPSCWQIDDKAV